MKNKKLAAMLLSLGLVGGVGVGATLAYFNSYSGPVTNTFTFGEGFGKDGIKLYEHVLKEGAATPELDNGITTTGVDYTNLYPGQTLPKDPTIELTTSTDAYLYITISKDELVNVTTDDSDFANWVQVKNGEAPVKVGDAYLYKLKNDVKASSDKQVIGVFNNVTIANTADGKTKPKNVVIKAAAVQKTDGINESTAQGIAIDLLDDGDLNNSNQ